MKELKEYRIAFQGLDLGDHEFEFDIKDEFFESFESADIKGGDLKVEVFMDRKESMMQLEISISGMVTVSCSRCLGEFKRPVFIEEDLIVKLGHETHEEAEDVLVLGSNEDFIDLAQYLYEYIAVSLPFQILHPEDEDGNSTCDPKVLELLETHEEEPTTDPRWDALKQLKGK